MEKPLVDDEFLLKKIEGKGGWTYTEIPKIVQDKHRPFGLLRVRGTIDDYEIKGFNLWSMKNGMLFMPVKAEIRKKIKKEAGDKIRVILFADNLPIDIPEELVECLQNEAGLFEKFLAYSEGEKKAFVNWIYSAKTDETRADRIVKTFEKIEKGQSFYM